jgi:hypothetical protein
MLQRFLDTHPEAAERPKGVNLDEQLDYFLRPRDEQRAATVRERLVRTHEETAPLRSRLGAKQPSYA